jgi:hypothetical protein
VITFAFFPVMLIPLSKYLEIKKNLVTAQVCFSTIYAATSVIYAKIMTLLQTLGNITIFYTYMSIASASKFHKYIKPLMLTSSSNSLALIIGLRYSHEIKSKANPI